MSDVNVQLVREFFELNGFRAMTFWQHEPTGSRGADHGFQLFVENIAPDSTRQPEFLLRSTDIAGLGRALVEVRAWHGDRVYASVIEANPVLLEVAGEESLLRARQVFDTDDFRTILVISELPASLDARQRSLDLLRRSGLDHVIEFPTILSDMLDTLSPFVSYAPSHTLQTLRLLKRYQLVRHQQLELPFPTEPPLPQNRPEVETVVMTENLEFREET